MENMQGYWPSGNAVDHPCSNCMSGPTVASATRQDLQPSLVPVQVQHQLHSCCKACLPLLASMSQSMFPFWGQNPLKVPLLCGFKRLSALQPMSSKEGVNTLDVGAEPFEEQDMEDADVIYKAPCGRNLRNHSDVMHFLVATESYDVLQVDLFTFNPSVRLDTNVADPRPELDLSRGAEATPVELCPGDSGARPPDFRYRRDRWPHGCFLSSSLTLFKVCCDCTDGCMDAEHCACIAATRDKHHYTYNRLAEPVPSGLYECGSWCNCDRARCQNRVVQRGIRIRLQVFPTEDKGWGVRCRDDLDRGTFVCMYAGLVLRRIQSPIEPPPIKMKRCELPSDDEVEVVTEWLAPTVLEGCSNLLETPLPMSSPNSPSLHVPVIQRPTDTTSIMPQDRDKAQKMIEGGDTQPEKKPVNQDAANIRKLEANKENNLKREATLEDVYLLDATKEGNVSRFINHSCKPNLFIQNVFTDSHEPGFPVIAFFTNRVVKAGTELTWNYSANTQSFSLQKQEVTCLCCSNSCQGQFTFEESLCDVCDVGSPAAN